MTDKKMCWDALGPFNMAPETNKTSTSNPITQDCVGEVQNDDLHMDTSRITGDEKGLDNIVLEAQTFVLSIMIIVEAQKVVPSTTDWKLILVEAHIFMPHIVIWKLIL